MHIDAKIEVVTRRKKKLTTYQGEVTGYSPPHEIGIRFSDGKIRAGLAVHMHYVLTPKEGGTILKYRVETRSTSKSILSVVKLAAYKFYFRSTSKQKLKKLKLLAEGKAVS